MADVKPEATAEAAAPPGKERAPLFSTTAWVVVIGICLIEGVIFTGVSKFAKTGDSKAPTDVAVSYWTLDPAFEVTIQDQQGFHGYEVKISLGVDKKLWEKEEEKKKIEDRKPKVYDVIFTVLQKQKWPDVVGVSGQASLKKELLGRMQEVLGQGVVQEVCFMSFSPRQ